MSDVVFGIDRELDEFCPICGLPIYKGDNGCKRYHKIGTKKQAQPKQHGKSKSPNRYYDYQ